MKKRFILCALFLSPIFAAPYLLFKAAAPVTCDVEDCHETQVNHDLYRRTRLCKEHE